MDKIAHNSVSHRFTTQSALMSLLIFSPAWESYTAAIGIIGGGANHKKAARKLNQSQNGK